MASRVTPVLEPHGALAVDPAIANRSADMLNLAFAVLALSFLLFMAFESHRVLTDSPRTSRRLVPQPVRVRNR